MFGTITIVESDTPQIPLLVLRLYKKIRQSWRYVGQESPLKIQGKKIREIIRNRKGFAIYDVHKIANLLDSYFIGCDRISEEKIAAYIFIMQL